MIVDCFPDNDFACGGGFHSEIVSASADLDSCPFDVSVGPWR